MHAGKNEKEESGSFKKKEKWWPGLGEYDVKGSWDEARLVGLLLGWWSFNSLK